MRITFSKARIYHEEVTEHPTLNLYPQAEDLTLTPYTFLRIYPEDEETYEEQ
ncbi:MAG TPA: hypothetical protein VFE88_01840 [Candidatus Nanoarchaeia archaeon]|nr:hypothetical protein [Candidatus Nanoarchaeia archaeon]